MIFDSNEPPAVRAAFPPTLTIRTGRPHHSGDERIALASIRGGTGRPATRKPLRSSVTWTTSIDSGAVGVAKPDPRIFELALALAGTTPERAVHVGDAYQYDVRGARAAGVRPVLVDPLGIRADADCERVASLVEVAALIS